MRKYHHAFFHAYASGRWIRRLLSSIVEWVTG